MPVTAIRLQNFMGFEDTGWLELRPLTLLFGKNSSGKSAIIRALRLLKQSLHATKETGPLLFNHDDGDDFGSFDRIVRERFYFEPETQMPRYLTFSFRCPVQPWRLERLYGELLSPKEIDELSFAEFHLSYECHVEAEQEQVRLSALMVELPTRLASEEKSVLIETLLVNYEKEWYDTYSDFLTTDILPPSSIKPVCWAGFVPDLFYVLPGTQLSTEQDKTIVPEDVANVLTVFEDCAITVREFLKSIHYLGPLRARPQRYYFSESAVNSWRRQEGLDVIQEFLKDMDERNEILVNEWMRRLDLGEAISRRPFRLGSSQSEKGYEVQIEKKGQTIQTSLREVGYGASQVLPVVLKALFANKGSLVIVEQPELHLHPAAQVELADLFIHQAVSDSDDGQSPRFLLETHSEHLILRALRRIRETTEDELEQGNPSMYVKDMTVAYVNQFDERSELLEIPVTPDGKFKIKWPKGFFVERANELF